MAEHNVTIGDREFTFFTLQAFSAVSHGMKLKKILAAGFSDLDAGLDEDTLEKVIFPILKDCAVCCTSEGKKLNDAKTMNAIYTVDDLDEFFELVAEVLKVNFGPLVKKTLRRFGVDLDQLDLEKVKAGIQAKAASLQK